MLVKDLHTMYLQLPRDIGEVRGVGGQLQHRRGVRQHPTVRMIGIGPSDGEETGCATARAAGSPHGAPWVTVTAQAEMRYIYWSVIRIDYKSDRLLYKLVLQCSQWELGNAIKPMEGGLELKLTWCGQAAKSAGST